MRCDSSLLSWALSPGLRRWIGFRWVDFFPRRLNWLLVLLGVLRRVLDAGQLTECTGKTTVRLLGTGEPPLDLGVVKLQCSSAQLLQVPG